jgi:predicted metal-dependent phosphoesterase TrpH
LTKLRLKLDLHIHSVYSPDSFNTIDTINKRLIEQCFDGYALTDHDTIEGVKEAQEKAGDLIIIPALEISAQGAHILALDPTDLVEPDLAPAETVELIHQQGATAILAHPYGLPRSWVNINRVKEAGFDAIEVANSAQIPYGYICSLNRKLAEKLGLPITGGSDSHIPETIGRSYTVVEADSGEVDDIIKAIRLGHTTVGGTYTRITEWFGKNFKKKRRLLVF